MVIAKSISSIIDPELDLGQFRNHRHNYAVKRFFVCQILLFYPLSLYWKSMCQCIGESSAGRFDLNWKFSWNFDLGIAGKFNASVDGV